MHNQKIVTPVDYFGAGLSVFSFLIVENEYIGKPSLQYAWMTRFVGGGREHV